MKLSILRAAMNPRNVQYHYFPTYKVQSFWAAVVLATGIPLGLYLEHQDVNRMTRFRDKSALYGKEKGPDEEPSWGDKEYYWKFSQWKRTWWY